LRYINALNNNNNNNNNNDTFYSKPRVPSLTNNTMCHSLCNVPLYAGRVQSAKRKASDGCLFVYFFPTLVYISALSSRADALL